MSDHDHHHHDAHEGHQHGSEDPHLHHVHSNDPDHLLGDFRFAKDDYFGNSDDSPLTDEQRENFTGLKYYPYNPELSFESELDRDVPADPVIMQTSTGDQQVYHRLGKVHFPVGDQEATVTIYQSHSGDLFIPIRDSTSGKETYGAGRYLEPELEEDETILIDFNYLYNPYCAYNDAWSCPLPPVENWLKVPIEAGEKSFGDDH